MKKKKQKVNVTATFSLDQYKKLKKLARRNCCTNSAVMRMVLTAYKDKEGTENEVSLAEKTEEF